MTAARPPFGRQQLNALGRKIRRLREQRGWSLKDIAKASGVSITAIRKIEAGETNPSLLTVVRVLDTLQISLDSLVRLAQSGSGHMHVVRGGSGDSRSAFVERIIGNIVEPQMRARMLSLPAGTDMVAGDSRDLGPQFGYVINGKVRVVFDDGSAHDLAAGDAVHTLDQSTRVLSNRSSKSAQILWVRDLRHAPVEQ